MTTTTKRILGAIAAAVIALSLSTSAAPAQAATSRLHVHRQYRCVQVPDGQDSICRLQSRKCLRYHHQRYCTAWRWVAWAR